MIFASGVVLSDFGSLMWNGVLYLGWNVGSILVLYWVENLIVGGYTLLKILVTGGTGELSRLLFFCIHYGFFCTIHGLAILELTRFAGEVSAPA